MEDGDMKKLLAWLKWAFETQPPRPFKDEEEKVWQAHK